MATWVAHMRIAENLLRMKLKMDERGFLVGNLGPDCNQANEDWSEFDPPKKTTHWFNDNNEIDAENFYNTYLTQDYDNKEQKSFLIGYYTHLLSDIEWRNIIKEQKDNYGIDDVSTIDKNFIRKVYKNWFNLDYLFLKNNRESIFYRVLKDMDEFPSYLDYFPEEVINTKLKYIVNFYDSYKDKLNRENKYLSERELDSYVNSTTRLVASIFHKRGICGEDS